MLDQLPNPKYFYFVSFKWEHQNGQTGSGDAEIKTSELIDNYDKIIELKETIKKGNLALSLLNSNITIVWFSLLRKEP